MSARANALLAYTLWLGACGVSEQAIATVPTESRANRLVCYLNHAGFETRKEPTGDRREPAWRILVQSDEYADALAFFVGLGIPIEGHLGVDSVQSSSLVPDPNLADARLRQGLAGEAARDLENISGVMRVDVSFNGPTERGLPTISGLLAPARPVPRPNASVLVYYVRDVGEVGSLDRHSIRMVRREDGVIALVADADASPVALECDPDWPMHPSVVFSHLSSFLPDLRPEDVSVAYFPSPLPAPAARAREPLLPSPGEVRAFWLFTIPLGVLAVAASGLLWVERRARRSPQTQVVAKTATVGS